MTECEKQVREQWEDRKIALTTLWDAYCSGEEDTEEYGSLYDYGLCFDYVAPETFSDQREGYWRYQLSYGGPSDEIRFYASTPESPLYRAEYWFLDWFDGAGHDVTEEVIISYLWDWFRDSETTKYTMEQALQS